MLVPILAMVAMAQPADPGDSVLVFRSTPNNASLNSHFLDKECDRNIGISWRNREVADIDQGQWLEQPGVLVLVLYPREAQKLTRVFQLVDVHGGMRWTLSSTDPLNEDEPGFVVRKITFNAGKLIALGEVRGHPHAAQLYLGDDTTGTVRVGDAVADSDDLLAKSELPYSKLVMSMRRLHAQGHEYPNAGETSDGVLIFARLSSVDPHTGDTIVPTKSSADQLFRRYGHRADFRFDANVVVHQVRAYPKFSAFNLGKLGIQLFDLRGNLVRSLDPGLIVDSQSNGE